MLINVYLYMGTTINHLHTLQEVICIVLHFRIHKMLHTITFSRFFKEIYVNFGGQVLC